MTIYIANREGTNLVKIGYARGDVAKRISQWQTGSPEPIVLLRTLRGDKRLERKIHQRFDHLRVRDGGGSEWFRADQQMCEQFAIEVGP